MQRCTIIFFEIAVLAVLLFSAVLIKTIKSESAVEAVGMAERVSQNLTFSDLSRELEVIFEK